MDLQRFDAAAEGAAAAHRLVDGITGACELPAARRLELAQLLEALPSRLAEVSAAVLDLQVAVESHRQAVAYLDTLPDVGALQSAAETIGRELDGARPRLLSLRSTVTSLSQDVAAAHERVSTVVADFDRAESAMREAADAVAEALDQSGRLHAGKHARGLATQAAGLLRSAGAATNLSSRCRLAENATQRATEAVDAARRAIHEHQTRVNHAASGFAAGFGAGTALGTVPGGGFGGGHGHGGGFGGGGSSGFGGGGHHHGGGGSSGF
jgi:hypothetical protein